MVDFDGIAFPREPRSDFRDARRILNNCKGDIRQQRKEHRRQIRRATKQQLAGHRGDRLNQTGWIA